MNKFLLTLIFASWFTTQSAWAEGEDDPLWKKSTYEKKVYNIGNRLLARNHITEKISFQLHHDREKVNAEADDTSNSVEIEKGLLNYIESDDELAAILAHEIAHITLDHGKHLRQGHKARGLLIATPLMAAGALAGPVGIAFGAAAGETINQRVTMANSRKSEAEADKVGFGYLVKAGYDADAMLSVLHKILSDGTLKKHLRTHPLGSERLKAIEAMITQYHTDALAQQPTEETAPTVQLNATEFEKSETQKNLSTPDVKLEDDTTPIDTVGDN